MTEVADGIYVGNFLCSFDSKIAWGSIIDVTNELPKIASCKKYLNIPSWDGCPPSVSNIRVAVEFAKTAPKPILIHCAHGKGRSVMVAAAILSSLGFTRDYKESIAVCKSLRPQSRVNHRMQEVLSRWQAERKSSEKT